MTYHPLSLHTYASKILEPIPFPILWLLNVCIMTFATSLSQTYLKPEKIFVWISYEHVLEVSEKKSSVSEPGKFST